MEQSALSHIARRSAEMVQPLCPMVGQFLRKLQTLIIQPGNPKPVCLPKLNKNLCPKLVHEYL